MNMKAVLQKSLLLANIEEWHNKIKALLWNHGSLWTVMISASEQNLDDSGNFPQFPLRKVSYFVLTPGAVKK